MRCLILVFFRVFFLDKCRLVLECRLGIFGFLAVDVDVVFVVDSFYGVGVDEYRVVLRLVDVVFDDLEVVVQFSTFFSGARVVLVMYIIFGFLSGVGRFFVFEGFYLIFYGYRIQMQRYVREALGRFLNGVFVLGYVLEWTLEKVFLVVSVFRRARVFFVIVVSEISSWDREKLKILFLEVKCKGIILFVLVLGLGVGIRELVDLFYVVSFFLEQYLLRFEGILDLEVIYVRRFIRVFLNFLKREQFLVLEMFWVGWGQEMLEFGIWVSRCLLFFYFS